jgi:hypothetical protein
MSTGHCCTQAPQLVQDQRTSGSITPASPSAAWIGPTSGRVASALTGSGRLSLAASAACR